MARRATESFNLSFLDIMSCGFGAIILLLMITKSSAPVPLESSEVVDEGSVRKLQEQLFTIRGETTVLNRELNAKHEQLSQYEERVARLRRELSTIQGRFNSTNSQSTDNDDEEGRLALARQQLTDEMKRLQASLGEQVKTDSVGGVPVDSEYIIFVIDTSGSMYNYAWNKLLDVVRDILNIYPLVKGIQIMSNEGDYMFSSYRGTWIDDSPARRQAILQRLRTWNPFSTSNPVPGIIKAISTYYEPDKKISIYVLGDEYETGGGGITQAVENVDRLNHAGEDGARLVRIHGIGFPTVIKYGGRYTITGERFATLMRELAHRNGGTFVALNDTE